MKIRREDGFLKIIVIVFPLIALGNTLEYFFVHKDDLKHVKGRVREIERKSYNCADLRYFQGVCEKTTIRLENVSGSFHVADDAGRDAYITGIEKGDQVDIYVRKWYQFILTLGAARDIYFLEKNGEIYYDMSRWKVSNMAFIILFGVLSLFYFNYFVIACTTISFVATLHSSFCSLLSNSVAVYPERSEGSHADAHGQHSDIYRRNSSGFCSLLSNCLN